MSDANSGKPADHPEYERPGQPMDVAGDPPNLDDDAALEALEDGSSGVSDSAEPIDFDAPEPRGGQAAGRPLTTADWLASRPTADADPFYPQPRPPHPPAQPVDAATERSDKAVPNPFSIAGDWPSGTPSVTLQSYQPPQTPVVLPLSQSDIGWSDVGPEPQNDISHESEWAEAAAPADAPTSDLASDSQLAGEESAGDGSAGAESAGDDLSMENLPVEEVPVEEMPAEELADQDDAEVLDSPTETIGDSVAEPPSLEDEALADAKLAREEAAAADWARAVAPDRDLAAEHLSGGDAASPLVSPLPETPAEEPIAHGGEYQADGLVVPEDPVLTDSALADILNAGEQNPDSPLSDEAMTEAALTDAADIERPHGIGPEATPATAVSPASVMPEVVSEDAGLIEEEEKISPFAMGPIAAPVASDDFADGPPLDDRGLKKSNDSVADAISEITPPGDEFADGKTTDDAIDDAAIDDDALNDEDVEPVNRPAGPPVDDDSAMLPPLLADRPSPGVAHLQASVEDLPPEPEPVAMEFAGGESIGIAPLDELPETHAAAESDQAELQTARSGADPIDLVPIAAATAVAGGLSSAPAGVATSTPAPFIAATPATSLASVSTPQTHESGRLSGASETEIGHSTDEISAHARADVAARKGVLSVGVITTIAGSIGFLGCVAAAGVLLLACVGLTPITSDGLSSASAWALRAAAVVGGLAVLLALPVVFLKRGLALCVEVAAIALFLAAFGLAGRSLQGTLVGINPLAISPYLIKAAGIGIALGLLGGLIEHRRMRAETHVLAAWFANLLCLGGGLLLSALMPGG